jgi:hypothetical protein
MEKTPVKNRLGKTKAEAGINEIANPKTVEAPMRHNPLCLST